MELTYETIKFLVQQFKSNLANVQFTKLNVGDHMAVNELTWSYWEFDSYSEMVAWTEINLPEQVENIPLEEMM